MVEPIRGKVAQILDSRQVVLNVGSADQVTEGMMFKIINPKGEQIRDPDTQRFLGSVESVKAFVRVVQVQENLTVATSALGNPASIGPVARALMPPRWVDEYDPPGANLRIVDVGDPVIQVVKVAGH